ncbi:unnamed protein product [Allacma fusca]|uniref:Uncharacterized protein n=1 Tax=Allacma fusca TaxID=39272 RepID=A0A8J2NND3_9HEXA|nr:unnamed protein product [Allacma fusca]
MSSNGTNLFKNKRERKAHLPKGSTAPKAKKPQRTDSDVKKVAGTPETLSEQPSTGSNLVAFGDVQNDGSVLSTAGLIEGNIKEECCDSDSHIKLKLNVGDTKFYNLKPRTKPDELNEELIFTRNLRRSVKFNDEFKRQSRASKRPKKEKVKNPCFGSISNSKKTGWSFDTPAPEELIKIHRRNFNLDEESLENDGPKLYRRPNGTVMDWDYFLTSDPGNLPTVPPVNCFKWAPFADIWEEIAIPGLCIELRNPFLLGYKERYWMGTIVHFAGYRALVKFESFETNLSNPHMAWISFCSDVPKPLGWCKKNNKELNPGPIIQGIEKKFIQKLIDEFSQRPTISPVHYSVLLKKIQQLQQHWKVSVPVEAMDVHSLHHNRLARITAVAGDRVHISFYTTEDDEDDYSDGYWFHYRSDCLHPVYWSQTVGMVLNGAGNISENSNFKLPPETFDTLTREEEPEEFLNLDAVTPRREHKFRIGDRVEAFEMINSSFLGPTSVQKIAEHLLLLHFDSWPTDVNRNYQWVDAESTEIYPIGYAHMLGLKWQGVPYVSCPSQSEDVYQPTASVFRSSTLLSALSLDSTTDRDRSKDRLCVVLCDTRCFYL